MTHTLCFLVFYYSYTGFSLCEIAISDVSKMVLITVNYFCKWQRIPNTRPIISRPKFLPFQTFEFGYIHALACFSCLLVICFNVYLFCCVIEDYPSSQRLTNRFSLATIHFLTQPGEKILQSESNDKLRMSCHKQSLVFDLIGSTHAAHAEIWLEIGLREVKGAWPCLLLQETDEMTRSPRIQPLLTHMIDRSAFCTSYTVQPL